MSNQENRLSEPEEQDTIIWRDLGSYRLIGDHPSGFVIVRPKDDKSPTPFDCPVCTRRMRLQVDIDMFVEHKCCDSCAIRWAIPRNKEWLEGWRPTHEELDRAYVTYQEYQPPWRASILRSHGT